MNTEWTALNFLESFVTVSSRPGLHYMNLIWPYYPIRYKEGGILFGNTWKKWEGTSRKVIWLPRDDLFDIWQILFLYHKKEYVLILVSELYADYTCWFNDIHLCCMWDVIDMDVTAQGHYYKLIFTFCLRKLEYKYKVSILIKMQISQRALLLIDVWYKPALHFHWWRAVVHVTQALMYKVLINGLVTWPT